MKVGSIVVYVGKSTLETMTTFQKSIVRWFPKRETEHITIREIRSSGDIKTGISKGDGEQVATFEEGVIAVVNGIEVGLNLRDLREIQSPEEGAALVEEAKEHDLVKI